VFPSAFLKKYQFCQSAGRVELQVLLMEDGMWISLVL
jgi:hypothetical protein